MNPAALRVDDNAAVPVLYIALELGNKTWKVVFLHGEGRESDSPSHARARSRQRDGRCAANAARAARHPGDTPLEVPVFSHLSRPPVSPLGLARTLDDPVQHHRA